MCVFVCIQSNYASGVLAYNDGDWLGTLRHMEESIIDYYHQVTMCQLACEGPYDHESLPDLYNAIAGQ